MTSGTARTEAIGEEKGTMPPDWSLVTLGDLASDFIGGGTPPTKEQSYWRGDIAWMRSAWISSRYVTRGEKHITREAIENSATHVVPENNLLIATRVSIGNVAINRLPIAISQDLTGVVVDRGKAEPEFLYWKIKASTKALRQLVQGSTIKGILREDLREIPLSVPSRLPEQRKIAEILSAADDAVQQTDQTIAEGERLRKGLMQQLLTQGVGHRRFRNTEIGDVPAEWEISELADVISEAKTGFASGKRDRSGVIQLRLDSLTTTGSIDTAIYAMVPPPNLFEQYLLRPGDVILANTSGSAEHIGKSALFGGKPSPCTFSNHLTRLRVRADLVLPEWVHAFLFRQWQLGVFRRIGVAQAGGQKNLPLPEVLRRKLPLPPIVEQKRIVEVFLTCEKRLENDRVRRKLLEELKGGLMQQLLTGKVRVKA